MSKLIDLSRTLDPLERDGVPAGLADQKDLVCPDIQFVHPDSETARQRWCAATGVPASLVPQGQGLGDESLVSSTLRWGTHVQSPLHSGARSGDKAARSITDIELSELLCNGLVLDLRALCQPGQAISINALQTALDAVGRKIHPGDAVLLRTGQERYTASDAEYFNYPGMTREGTLFLTTHGARVLGTDALSWDRPLPIMRQLYQETGDPRHFCDGHLAVREKEAFIVAQLANLGALPVAGFKVAFFPIKVRGASAAPCRAVAFLND